MSVARTISLLCPTHHLSVVVVTSPPVVKHTLYPSPSYPDAPSMASSFIETRKFRFLTEVQPPDTDAGRVPSLLRGSDPNLSTLALVPLPLAGLTPAASGRSYAATSRPPSLAPMSVTLRTMDERLALPRRVRCLDTGECGVGKAVEAASLGGSIVRAVAVSGRAALEVPPSVRPPADADIRFIAAGSVVHVDDESEGETVAIRRPSVPAAPRREISNHQSYPPLASAFSEWNAMRLLDRIEANSGGAWCKTASRAMASFDAPGEAASSLSRSQLGKPPLAIAAIRDAMLEGRISTVSSSDTSSTGREEDEAGPSGGADDEEATRYRLHDQLRLSGHLRDVYRACKSRLHLPGSHREPSSVAPKERGTSDRPTRRSTAKALHLASGPDACHVGRPDPAPSTSITLPTPPRNAAEARNNGNDDDDLTMAAVGNSAAVSDAVRGRMRNELTAVAVSALLQLAMVDEAAAFAKEPDNTIPDRFSYSHLHSGAQVTMLAGGSAVVMPSGPSGLLSGDDHSAGSRKATIVHGAAGGTTAGVSGGDDRTDYCAAPRDALWSLLGDLPWTGIAPGAIIIPATARQQHDPAVQEARRSPLEAPVAEPPVGVIVDDDAAPEPTLIREDSTLLVDSSVRRQMPPSEGSSFFGRGPHRQPPPRDITRDAVASGWISEAQLDAVDASTRKPRQRLQSILPEGSLEPTERRGATQAVVPENAKTIHKPVAERQAHPEQPRKETRKRASHNLPMKHRGTATTDNGAGTVASSRWRNQQEKSAALSAGQRSPTSSMTSGGAGISPQLTAPEAASPTSTAAATAQRRINEIRMQTLSSLGSNALVNSLLHERDAVLFPSGGQDADDPVMDVIRDDVHREADRLGEPRYERPLRFADEDRQTQMLERGLLARQFIVNRAQADREDDPERDKARWRQSIGRSLHLTLSRPRVNEVNSQMQHAWKEYRTALAKSIDRVAENGRSIAADNGGSRNGAAALSLPPIAGQAQASVTFSISQVTGFAGPPPPRPTKPTGFVRDSLDTVLPCFATQKKRQGGN